MIAATKAAFFADAIDQFGDAPALVDDAGTEVTYAELARRADDFSARLGSDRQLVFLDATNTVESIVALAGCLRRRHPVIIGAKANYSRATKAFSPNVTVDGAGNATLVEGAEKLSASDDLAVMLSTSGSTGATKLVRLSRNAINSNAHAIADYLSLGPNDRALCTLPIHYSYGMSIINSHLAVGASVLLSHQSVTEDTLWDLCRSVGVTNISGVPYTYDLLEASGFRDRSLPSLRVMTQAGGRMAPELIASYARWGHQRGVRFFAMYGQTEAAPRIAYLPPELAEAYPDCIGRAIPGGELRIEDLPHDKDARQVGELVYRGPNVMMGYAENREDLARGFEFTELRTGDLAQQTGEGLFKIVGRSSRFSKIAGLRFGFDDIEALVREHQGPSIVTGNDELIVIALIGEEGIDEKISAASKLLASKTSIPERSRVIISLSVEPRLPSGKVDYRTVLQAGIDARKAEEEEGRASGEETLTFQLKRLLRLPSISNSDTFAALAADSLSFVTASIIVEEALGALPPHWERLTMGELEALSRAGAGRRGYGFRSVDTEVVLRSIAIVAVVAHHALFIDIGGGVDILLLLVGVNLARLQAKRLATPSRWRLIGDALKTLVIPYLIVVAFFWVHNRHSVVFADLALVSNFLFPENRLLTPYWFVLGYVQIVVILVAVATIGPISRLISSRPWAFGLSWLTTALVVKVVFLAVFSHQHLLGRTVDQFGFIVAMGWCIQEATTSARRLVVASAALAVLLLDKVAFPTGGWTQFDGYWHSTALFAATVTLLYFPSMRLPRLVRYGMLTIASASLLIYLLHPLVLAALSRYFETPRPSHLSSYAFVVLATLSGVIVERLLRYNPKTWLFTRMTRNM